MRPITSDAASRQHGALSPQWPALLLCQYLLLAWGAGIFASRFWLPALCALVIISLAALRHRADADDNKIPQLSPASRLSPKRSKDSAQATTKLNKFCLLVFLLLSFGLGCGYATLRTPVKPVFPVWLIDAIQPDADGGRNAAYKNGLRIRAKVDEVNGLTDRRLQLILSEARVLEPPDESLPTETEITQRFPGRIAFTWYLPSTPEAPKPLAPGIPVFRAIPKTNDAFAPLPHRPLPGQDIELLLRPRPVRGLKNPGLWDIEPYWADQGVWLRASATGPSAEARLLCKGAEVPNSLQLMFSSGRETIRLRVLAALPRIERMSPEAESSGQSGQSTLGRSEQTALNQPEPRLAPGADFLPALLFGDRFLLDSPDTELFARSTLMHSLALSGLHLGYAAALGYALAHLLYRCFPQLGSRLPRQKCAVCLAMLPALLYLWLGGAPPSLLRSALMLFFCGLLLWLRRPAVLLDSLFWAVGIILLCDPLALFDLRLQLSALAIAAIALCAPLLAAINARLRLSALPRPLTALASACLFTLGISFAVQLTLMPLLVKSFGLYGLAFPLNLLWLPVLGLVVMPLAFGGLAAAALNFSSLAQICFKLAALPCDWLMDFLRWLDKCGSLPVSLPVRPHWTFMLGFWLLLALLPQIIQACMPMRQIALCGVWGRTPQKKSIPLLLAGLGLILCLFPLALRQYETSRDIVRLRLLDVGQGQAVLLEWPGGGRLLLDGGGSMSPRFDLGKEVIAATLTGNRPARLDYLLLSHPDMDHLRGLLFPLEHLEVGYYADNGPPEQHDAAYLRLRELLRQKGLAANRLQSGQILKLSADLHLEILHPPGSPRPAKEGEPGAGNTSAQTGEFDGNNASLVARLVWRGEPLALLCGDAEQKAQRFLLKNLTEAKPLRDFSELADLESVRGVAEPESLQELAVPEPLQAQVLLLPHHGAAGAFLPDFLAAVKPDLALAGCGYANRWGFPSKAARAGLASAGVPLLNTGDSGQIIVEWSNGGKTRTVTESR